jgi:proline dehydrogenase
MLSSLLLRASRSQRVKQVSTAVPITRRVVDRFVAGEDDVAALRATAELVARGRLVSIDRLGEGVTDRVTADQTAEAYVTLLNTLLRKQWGGAVEVSVKLSGLGQALGPDGDRIALDNARRICAAAAAADTTVTIDMEDHTTTEATLQTVRELRADFAGVGTVLQAMLYRTDDDCRALAQAGSRVRLVKGAYQEPAAVARQDKTEVDEAYLRCLQILMDGDGYPMIGTHDPHMITAGLALGAHRDPDSYEFQMLYGIRTDEQQRLQDGGHRMRVYVPYGQDWYGYFMRRLAERPANVGFFLRALVGR